MADQRKCFLNNVKIRKKKFILISISGEKKTITNWFIKTLFLND
jgi:hypothetical protein